MSYELNELAVQMFRNEWSNQYTQSIHKLDGAYIKVMGVVGDAYKWPIAGNSDMIQRSGQPFSHIPAQYLPYERVTTTFTPYQHKIPTDKTFTQAEVNVNELSILSKKHQQAIFRRQDQFIIDALNASTTTNVIVDGGTNMDLEKLLSVLEYAVVNNWTEDGTWHIAIHASQLKSLLQVTEVTSSDYATVKALVNGQINQYLGFTFHRFGNLSTGGLPKTGDIRTCFAWKTDAVGMAYNVSPEVHVFPINDDLYINTVSELSAGANAILNEGIIKINCDETA